MNEIRKDYLLDRWVILSSKRAFRPQPREKKLSLAALDKTCPFCPGNEHMTPPTIIQKPESGGWEIRVFENKYPAVVKSIRFEQKLEKLRNRKSGYGFHYMMVDVPEHNLHPGFYSMRQWKLWFETIKDIFSREAGDERIKFIMIYKNHGIDAGASQPHPHTQIVALPSIPFLINEEMRKASEYFNFEGRCVFCDIVEMESDEHVRVVLENKYVIAICPYAPLWPYEVWIIPKEHVPSIQMKEKTANELLNTLRIILKTYYSALDDPSFNFYIHTAYLRMEDHVAESYHFHIEVFPRLEKDAGFELGSAMNITTLPPEDSASFLRRHIKD
ncbi:MAG: galactose-1-phosphate uridylyltransferase [Candidatus Asgardarchaeia archaeon]